MQCPVPFFPNTGDDKRCYQAAMQSVLWHFLGKEWPPEELDRMTCRESGQGTWTPQIVPVLTELGLHVRFFTTQPLEPLLAGKEAIRSIYGANAEAILALTNVPALQQSIKWILKHEAYEMRSVPFAEVEGALMQGHVPLLLLDVSVLEERPGPYHGHFIVVTGCDNDHVFYHESGPHRPQPHRRIPKERFTRAWEAPGTDKDLVIIAPPTPTLPL